MFDSVAAPTALERARAALQSVERRVGVEDRDQVVTFAPAEPAPLTELLPDGDLPVGAAVGVGGSASLMGWLLGATQRDRWIALVGWPELSPVALAEAGVDLDHVVVVPDVGGRAAAVLAALLDGVEIVVAGPQAALTAGERRRLLARARHRAISILSLGRWEGAALVLDVEHSRWGGPDHGAHWLRETHLGVVRHSRADGAGARFEVTRYGTSAPTALATRAAARRRVG